MQRCSRFAAAGGGVLAPTREVARLVRLALAFLPLVAQRSSTHDCTGAAAEFAVVRLKQHTAHVVSLAVVGKMAISTCGHVSGRPDLVGDDRSYLVAAGVW